MELEEYLKDLAQKLRWRRVDGRAVTEALREVSSEVLETGSTPAARFGDASAYAEQFDRGHATSPGLRLATIGALVATLIAAAHVVMTLSGALPSSVPRSLTVYAGCALALIISVLVGYRLDRRLPPGVQP